MDMTSTLTTPRAIPAPTALDEARLRVEAKTRGAIFTKPSVVDFILDLAGYVPSRPLYELSLLEPSFGGGQFVRASVDRLLKSWHTSDERTDVEPLLGSIRAVELDPDTYEQFRSELIDALVSSGLKPSEARLVAETWLLHDDFLAPTVHGDYDFIVGNPPYVRQENIANDALADYRRRFPTMVGRADLYIPFIEKSLDLLKPNGRVAFICSDAWVKNDYGRALRRKIAQGFHLVDYVDMYGVDAFETEVGAYPSITVISKSPASTTRVSRAQSADRQHLAELHDHVLSVTPERLGGHATVRQVVRNGGDPWLLGRNDHLPAVLHMEANFPTLAEAGVTVGIGVATGADKVFIAPFDQLDVEDDRKLPLATNRCVSNGGLAWTGKGVINPYRDDGTLVDLADFPRLAVHFEQHRALLEARHTAKSDPSRRWYKTIDRITPSLTKREKLLVPDIKGDGDSIAYDPGTLYPHHNLYYLTSATWNLRALQALLRSGIAHLFVEAYSVRIGGGYLRFQAQNLKRIRIPNWDALSDEQQRALVAAGEAGLKLDIGFLEHLYGLDLGFLAFMEASE